MSKLAIHTDCAPLIQGLGIQSTKKNSPVLSAGLDDMVTGRAAAIAALRMRQKAAERREREQGQGLGRGRDRER